jgi:hypothetical protein
LPCDDLTSLINSSKALRARWPGLPERLWRKRLDKALCIGWGITKRLRLELFTMGAVIMGGFNVSGFNNKDDGGDVDVWIDGRYLIAARALLERAGLTLEPPPPEGGASVSERGYYGFSVENYLTNPGDEGERRLLQLIVVCEGTGHGSSLERCVDAIRSFDISVAMTVYCSQGLFAVYHKDLHTRSMHLLHNHPGALGRLDKYEGRGFTASDSPRDSDPRFFLQGCDPNPRVDYLIVVLHQRVAQFSSKALNFV